MKFWTFFWRVCKVELQNVSFSNLIILTLIGAVFVHMSSMIYVRVKKHAIYLRSELLIVLFVSYTIFIAQITFLSLVPGNQERVIETKWLWIDRSMKQNITNLLSIILFVPFGIFLARIHMNRKSLKRMVMVLNYSFLTSLFTECTKYITKRGYFETDNIEANILGGLSGCLLFDLCLRIGRLMHTKKTEVEDEREAK